ncbi:MAG TPA: XrtA system polysaccharide chain length determinant [Woeseiaceae bacterium]|nr:XrtA system polysaccharide chain length determinant [Woeseiaceae bacterium]
MRAIENSFPRNAGSYSSSPGMNIQELIAEAFEYARGMWRYRWWAAGCAWLISVLGWFYVYSMPDVYSASARVYVDTKSLMRPTFEGLAISENLTAQVEAVSRALLTRPNLEAVARETDLDLRVDTPRQMELLITSLQERIKVDGNREHNVFSISYEDPDREKAREVVAAIVDAFVENSLEGQGNDAAMTARALDAEISDHESRLEAAERDLAQFKKDNLGYMPNDRGDYYDRLQQALGAVTQTESQLRQVRQRRDELQRQIAGEEPVFGIMSAMPGASSTGCSQQAQIAQLKAELATLLVDFTEKHPSIVSSREIIAQLEEACGAERRAAAAAGVPAVVSPEQPLQANPVYQNLRIQLTNAEVELAGLEAQLKTHRSAVAQLRADVDKIAEVEASLKQLNRDYEVVQARYQELLVRREQLQSKERLDPVTDAVQFRTLEPPFAGIQPVGPNRPLLLIVVLMFALGAGGAVALGLSQLKPVFFTRRSLQRIGGLPVLGSVSMLLSPGQAYARRKEAYLWAAAYGSLIFMTVLAMLFEAPASALLRQLSGGIGV